MQCPVCSKDVGSGSAFCNSCGARMPLGAATAGPSTAPGHAGMAGAAAPMYAAQPIVARPGISDNAAAAISYLTIIPAIIFLVLEPYNRVPLVRFHAFQSIGLTIAAIALQVVVMISEIVLHFIPGIFLLFTLVHLLLGIGLFILWLLAIFKASKGEWYKLPLIGDFAEKQARS